MGEKRYRDAVTGEYVTEWYAKEHPESTVAETDETTEERLVREVNLPDEADE